MEQRYTRVQIGRILRERGWTKSGTLWYASKGHFKHLGVSLRDAASLEMLTASESLDAPRRRKGNQWQLTTI